MVHSFGGYGASISYSETSSKEISRSDSESFEVSGSFSINIDIELLIFSIGPHLKFAVTIGGGYSETTKKQTTHTVSRKRGFTLSDPDEYDYFDVQV